MLRTQDQRYSDRRQGRAPAVRERRSGEKYNKRDAPLRRGVRTALNVMRLWLLTVILGKGGVDMMAMFFAQRVILGKPDAQGNVGFDAVPKLLKGQVAEILIDSGLPELVPTEFGGAKE